MEKIVNLTPHAINLMDNDGQLIMTVDPSGTVARVSTHTVTYGTFAGIPLTRTQYGTLENLPAPQPDTIYIVSSIVAQRCGRPDLFVPNESVRDENGRIIGCKSLARI